RGLKGPRLPLGESNSPCRLVEAREFLGRIVAQLPTGVGRSERGFRLRPVFQGLFNGTPQQGQFRCLLKAWISIELFKRGLPLSENRPDSSSAYHFQRFVRRGQGPTYLFPQVLKGRL